MITCTSAPSHKCPKCVKIYNFSRAYAKENYGRVMQSSFDGGSADIFVVYLDLRKQ